MATDKASSEPLKEDDEIAQLKVSLQREKAAKRKMYSYLVKIADELKSLVSPHCIARVIMSFLSNIRLLTGFA